MTDRRTVDDIKKRAFNGWQGSKRMVRSPAEAGIYLAVTPKGCLTHIVRYVSNWGGSRASFEALCGIHQRVGAIVDPATELFGCHRCIAQAIKYGEPTYNLVPNTGCEATGGQRFRPRKDQPKETT